MKNIALACLLLTAIFSCQQNKSTSPPKSKSPEPNDYLFLQRAYPYDRVPSEAYYNAVNWVQSQAIQRDDPIWEMAGPANVGGRITDIAMHTSDLQTIYVASASGGVWKSENAGQTWLPTSDGLPSLSIGDIAIDPSDKNTLYCGTGVKQTVVAVQSPMMVVVFSKAAMAVIAGPPLALKTAVVLAELR